MPERGPRIVLVGRSYRALCALEHLLERGETVAAFIGQEGGDVEGRDFCHELHDVCERSGIPARSARKLGEEVVRWLDDRIRPDLALCVGTTFEVPLAIGGNIRHGLIEAIDDADGVVLRQRGHDLIRRRVAATGDEAEPEDAEQAAAAALCDALDEYLGGLQGPRAPLPAISFERAPLTGADMQIASERAAPGPDTDALEREAADYLGASRVVAVDSARAAFRLVLDALDIGEGDEVICPALASGAVLDAVRASGARMRLADVQPSCMTIDPDQVRELCSERTRALVVSHPFGQPAELDALYGAAADAGLDVIEDATAALGARFEHSRIGRDPCTAVFRLPLANPAPAAAPALITLPEALAPLADRAQRIGDGIAELARRRLAGWEDELAERRRVATRYSSELVRYDAFQVPVTPAERLPVYASYALRVRRFSRASADDLHKLMGETGIETRLLQLPLGTREVAELPGAERIRTETLLLPCDGLLGLAEQDRVLDALFDYAIG